MTSSANMCAEPSDGITTHGSAGAVAEPADRNCPSSMPGPRLLTRQGRGDGDRLWSWRFNKDVNLRKKAKYSKYNRTIEPD